LAYQTSGHLQELRESTSDYPTTYCDMKKNPRLARVFFDGKQFFRYN